MSGEIPDLKNRKKLLEWLGLTEEDLEKLPQKPKEHRSLGIIGTAGHVDHGKSTLTEAITGKFPAQHSEELTRGITIKLGYAHLDLMICPKCYGFHALKSNANPRCEKHPDVKLRWLRCYSILDHPGHEILVSTMLQGASIIDYGLVVIAANEPCPRPQTREHVAALEVMGVKHIIVAQNKIELVSEEQARKNLEQIVNFFTNETSYGVPPIIPVSAALRINTDILLAAIYKYFPPKQPKTSGDPLFYIARSFDANRPGTPINKLIGGALGGALKQGILRVGDEIEIRPGYITPDGRAHPLYSEIVSIRTDGGHTLEYAQPNALIGIATNLDPALTKADGLAGNLAGKPGRLPDIVRKIIVKKVHLFKEVIGARVRVPNKPPKPRERLLIVCGTNINMGIVDSFHDDELEITLLRPICMPKGERVALLRMVEREYRLIGYGLLDY